MSVLAGLFFSALLLLPQFLFAQTPSYFGNQSAMDGFGDFALNDNTFQGSVRFTARSAGVSAVSLYFSQTTGGSAQYTVELHGDNGGVPGVTVLASSNITVSSVGWQNVFFGF